MSEYRLKTLELEAYGPFRDKQVLQLPSNGCVLLRGRNLDTGGGSGTGKSVVLSAVDIALEYGDVAMTDLQCWHTDKPLRVRLQLDGPTSLAVTRGGRASLEVGDAKPVHGAKAITEGLLKYLGMPPKVLEALTVRRQRSPGGNFLSRANAGFQDFLALILDLRKYELQLKDSEDREEKLETAIHCQQAALLYRRIQVEQLLAHPVKEPDLTYQQALEAQLVAVTVSLQGLAVELRNKETGLTALRQEHAAWEGVRAAGQAARARAFAGRRRQIHEQAGLPVYSEERVAQAIGVRARAQDMLKAAEAELNHAKTDYEDKLFLAQQRVLEYQRLVNGIPGEKLKVEQLQARLKLIESQLCPTCLQSWVTDSLQQEKEKVQEELQLLQQRVALPYDVALEEARKAVVALQKPSEEKVNDLRAIVADYGRVISEDRLRFNQEVEHARAEIQEQLRAIAEEEQATEQAFYQTRDSWEKAAELQALESYCASVRATSNSQEQELESLNRDLDHTRQFLAAERQKTRAYQQELAVGQKELQAREAELLPVEADIRAEKDFQALIGREGFMGKIFEETLQAISDETNSILASVPNTAAVELRFETEYETQKGTINRKIRPVVTVLGHEATLKGPACSGGMKAVVELAVDLAVRNVVCQRLGVTPQWLILDEPMDGLGDVEKEAVLEILQRQAQNCLIIVVDHSTAFKAFFSEVIEVQYQAGVSTLTSGPMLSSL